MSEPRHHALPAEQERNATVAVYDDLAHAEDGVRGEACAMMTTAARGDVVAGLSELSGTSTRT